MCILLDTDIILADVKMNYNGSISKKSYVKDSKYIFKEIKLYYLGWPIGGYPCELCKKQKSCGHTRIQTHTCNHRHIHANTQRRRMHVKTHACTRACARVHTHTHKVFFRVRRPDIMESLAAHWGPQLQLPSYVGEYAPAHDTWVFTMDI